MNDVCFILEGTYPFIRGGVSSWTHHLIEGMPDLTFSLLVLSPVVGPPKKSLYVLPKNVNTLVEVFLYNANIPALPCPNRRHRQQFWEGFFNFLTCQGGAYMPHFEKIFPLLCDPLQRAVNARDVLYAPESQELTEKLYDFYQGTCPFFDFFWTWRSMLLVFLQALHVEIPPARIYHILCTGYAGLAGVIAKLKHQRCPLILTEHGIYTKERKIEINQAEWIQKKERQRAIIEQSQGTIKDLWVENFIRLGRLTYEYSEMIFTLYSGNKDLQIEFGAQPEKIQIIPNGVQVDQYLVQRPLQQQRLQQLQPTDTRIVGLVGRVVPIKDIKMFVKVCKIVLDSMPNVLFQVIGPTEEDEAYYRECLELAEMLGVKEVCQFTGPKNLIQEKTYAQLDIMALTSISEGQPLTILEALCVGVPCVATDVGACHELLHGRTEEDKALGICGYIVPIGNAEAFAQACLQILRNLPLHKKMVETGYQRVDKYYQQKDIVRQYKELYTHYLNKTH